MKGLITKAIVPMALAVVTIGCGSQTVAKPPGTSASTAGVRLANNPQLGQILVDSRGRTLYYLLPEQGAHIVCIGDCRSNWAPLLIHAGSRSSGPSLPGTLGTVSRPDGGIQVTYDSWPLYTYVRDTHPGDILGKDTGGQWLVAMAAGLATPTPAPAAPAPATPMPEATAAPPVAAPAPPPPVAAPAPVPRVAPPPPSAPPAPAPVMRPFNDGDADNRGGPNDGDGNG